MGGGNEGRLCHPSKCEVLNGQNSNLNTPPWTLSAEGSIHRSPPAGGSAGDAAGLPNPRPVNTPQGESPARMTWADQSAALAYRPLSLHPGGTGQLDPQPPSRPASWFPSWYTPGRRTPKGRPEGGRMFSCGEDPSGELDLQVLPRRHSTLVWLPRSNASL